jgi:ABC-type oligopeptide transport system substrate-binding subunit
LVEGLTLRQLPPEHLDDVLAIARQVCAALAHAHDKDIIHRDLKPENVLLAPDGLVKLVDFGLARQMASRLTSDGTILGTVFYIAPELALGRPFDGRADLYALGVMLYELTTGRLPFCADDPLAVISQHLHAPVIPPRAKNDQIPPALDSLVVSLLAKDPAERPSSASQVLQTLWSGTILAMDTTPPEELSVLERIERGRLVGRDRELDEAKALWSRALANQGQVLLISGEPGIGKTRFARELVTQVEISGGQALTGASFSEGNAPYNPFRQIVQQVLCSEQADSLQLPDQVLAELLSLVPEVQSRYPDVQENPPLDPQAERQRLLESLLVFFTALANRAPLLLAVKDAHWADSGTLLALKHLARHTRQQPLMLVITFHSVEGDQTQPLHEMLLDLNRERLASHVRLPRLNRQQTGKLLEILFDEEITADFLTSIYDETEGNPFFVEEMVKALVESGKLRFEDGRWHRPETRELGLPHTVRVAIQSRIKVLSPPAFDTLRLAAVLGRQFDLDTLSEASELDEDLLTDALEQAERAQLIEESRSEQGVFAFVHGLIATTLLDDLRVPHLRKLHHQPAGAVKKRRPDDLESLAHHYSQAGETEQALGYLLRAGDRARSLYAQQEAIDNYQQALELLKETGDLERAARTLIKLGLTYHNGFDFAASRRAYDEGFELWQQAIEIQPTSPPAPAPHTLRATLPSPITLDPGLATDDPSTTVIRQLYNGLVQHSPEMNVVPDLARHWEVLDDGRRYVFYLRDDLVWSDETPLTSEDFAYAWRRVLDPDVGSGCASYLYDIRGAREYHQGQTTDPDQVAVSTPDEATLMVELVGPTSYFLHLLTHASTFPVPRHAVETHGASWAEPANMVTCGPFRISGWEHGGSLLLERNLSYHGRLLGNLTALEFVDAGNHQSVLERYQDDRLDVLYLAYLPPAERHRARQLHSGDYVAGPTLWSQYLCFDLSRPPFDNARVRKAFTMAADRETLAHVVNRGYVFPATGGLVPPGMPGHSPEIALPYAPEQARTILGEAGFHAGRGFPEVECLAVTGFEDVTSFLHEGWLEILGVDTTWAELDFGALVERLSADRPHMWISGWSADYPDPDSFFRSSAWNAEVGWQNQDFHNLVDQARRVTSQQERMAMYQQAERILVDQAPLLPLAYGRAHWLVKPWVTRFPTSPIGGCHWRDVVISVH